MADIKVGDEVRVFKPYIRNGQTDGIPGTVVKIGRKLVDIEHHGHTEKFRLENGQLAGSSYGNIYFLTLGEVAERQRRRAAEDVLRERKIRLESGHDLTLEQVEALADLVRSFGKEA